MRERGDSAIKQISIGPSVRIPRTCIGSVSHLFIVYITLCVTLFSLCSQLEHHNITMIKDDVKDNYLLSGLRCVRASAQLHYLQITRSNGNIPKGIATQMRFRPSANDQFFVESCKQLNLEINLEC